MQLITPSRHEGHRKSSRGFARTWRRTVLLVTLLAVLGGQTVLRAAFIDFSDSTSFGAAVQSGSYLNDFTGAGTAASLSFSGGTGPFSYTVTSPPGGVTEVMMAPATGLGDSLSNFGQVAMIITFTGGNKPTAVGGNFFWSDNSSPSHVVSGTVHADFKIGGISVHTLDIFSSGDSSIGFGGVTTDGAAFDSVTLTLVSPIGTVFPSMDNFRVGINAVPEPGGWVAAGFVAFFVLGRTGLGFVQRRLARQ